jgi:hypothetical protein
MMRFNLKGWVVIIGQAFGSGLYVVGPFSSCKAAEKWVEERGGGEVICCLDSEITVLDPDNCPMDVS